MIEQVAKNIYMFPVPLPGSPLKVLNCFVIKGDKKHLMIDVGFNTQVGYDAITSAFAELGISLADTDIFLTHLHADHTGLIEVLKHECGDVYIGELDSLHVNSNPEDVYWEEYMQKQSLMGFPKGEYLPYTEHPAYTGGVLSTTDFIYVTNGMKFPYGGYNFEAVDLKGHTPGQKGLFDKESGVFICGDHILNKISPNINLWDFKADYLGIFLKNLKKIKDMNVKTVLCGHRALVPDVNERIDELLAHHDRRLAHCLEILSSGKSTVYEVSNEVEWDYGGGHFRDFPNQQKWFASSEVFAHLEHLRRLGKVDLKIDHPTFHYSVKA